VLVLWEAFRSSEGVERWFCRRGAAAALIYVGGGVSVAVARRGYGAG